MKYNITQIDKIEKCDNGIIVTFNKGFNPMSWSIVLRTYVFKDVEELRNFLINEVEQK